ncbi:hypothetical protein ASPBRDRAFT_235631 [Aspergillus brasiliensis CBS 101740]|uniref:Secreted protein n=1 Tax=Aspergillus brasiliensis (strain CBS 101740 / IMI 381727 / IBT 21946) TaxID=767769 RepID=A0A1L9V049_ASPBC|nr:hypothetical protein ASPBRDRAFT_235631 [Aspergillus brasiliensis CBS 101740]
MSCPVRFPHQLVCFLFLLTVMDRGTGADGRSRNAHVHASHISVYHPHVGPSCFLFYFIFFLTFSFSTINLLELFFFLSPSPLFLPFFTFLDSLLLYSLPHNLLLFPNHLGPLLD